MGDLKKLPTCEVDQHVITLAHVFLRIIWESKCFVLVDVNYKPASRHGPPAAPENRHVAAPQFLAETFHFQTAYARTNITINHQYLFKKKKKGCVKQAERVRERETLFLLLSDKCTWIWVWQKKKDAIFVTLIPSKTLEWARPVNNKLTDSCHNSWVCTRKTRNQPSKVHNLPPPVTHPELKPASHGPTCAQ